MVAGEQPCVQLRRRWRRSSLLKATTSSHKHTFCSSDYVRLRPTATASFDGSPPPPTLCAAAPYTILWAQPSTPPLRGTVYYVCDLKKLTHWIQNGCPSLHADTLENRQHGQTDVVEWSDAKVGTMPLFQADRRLGIACEWTHWCGVGRSGKTRASTVAFEDHFVCKQICTL